MGDNLVRDSGGVFSDTGPGIGNVFDAGNKSKESNKDLKLSKYPDSKSKNLRKEISKTYKCDFNKVICGSGSDEIIQMLCQLYLKPKDEVIVPEYSFLMYRIYAKIIGGNVIYAK